MEEKSLDVKSLDVNNLLGEEPLTSAGPKFTDPKILEKTHADEPINQNTIAGFFNSILSDTKHMDSSFIEPGMKKTQVLKKQLTDQLESQQRRVNTFTRRVNVNQHSPINSAFGPNISPPNQVNPQKPPQSEENNNQMEFNFDPDVKCLLNQILDVLVSIEKKLK